MAARALERRRAGGVARDHQQLRARVRAGARRSRSRTPASSLLGAVAVREAGGVAEVQVVLGRAATRAARAGRSSPPTPESNTPTGLLGKTVPSRGAWCQRQARAGTLRSHAPRARAGRHEHVPDAGAAGARQLRPRPGRGAATDRRDRGRGVRVRARRRRRIPAPRADLCDAAGTAAATSTSSTPTSASTAGRRSRSAARSRAVTLHGTDLSPSRARARSRSPALPLLDLVATVSEALARPGPALGVPAHRAVLPVGVDLERFRPIPRAAGARRRSGSIPTARTCCSRPTRHAPRSATTGREARRRRRAAADPRRRRPGAGPAVGQRRQRGARPVRPRGLRPRGARGAGLRRAGARDAGRDRTRGAERRRRDATADRSTTPPGAPRSRRTSQTPIRGSTDARAPSGSPPT